MKKIIFVSIMLLLYSSVFSQITLTGNIKDKTSGGPLIGVTIYIPDLKTGAAAWIYAGGAHHTAFSQAVNAEYIEDFCNIAGVEYLPIDNDTCLHEFKNELRWNDVYYMLAK